MKDQPSLQQHLLSLLLDLDGIQQDHRFHPEGDALYHSLQVFQVALQNTDDPILLSAALFHDIGKVYGSKNHDKLGAEMLTGLLNSQITWLIEHHLDLLKNPTRTRKNLRHNRLKLISLQNLRKWDLAGRNPYADVLSPEQAISTLFKTRGIASIYHE